MSAKAITILIVGLGYDAATKINPQLTKEVYGTILSSITRLYHISGLTCRLASIDPDLPAGDPDSVPSLLRNIASGPVEGQQWDAVLIGSGIRMLPKMVPLLEQIVNTASSSSKGATKLLFSADAVDHETVIKRSFPELL